MEQWKAVEAAFGEIFGVHRAPANSGGVYDIPRPEELHESPVLGQAKNREKMSLNALTKEAEIIAEEATKLGKFGVVGVKAKRGRGKKSPLLVVATETETKKMLIWAYHLGVLGKGLPFDEV